MIQTKLKLFILLFTILVSSCAFPKPNRNLLAVAGRITLTQSNVTWSCPSTPFAGLTINASNVKVIGHCLVQDAVGTGLQVAGDNVDLLLIDINGVTIGNGDTDYARFFGNNINVHGGRWTNLKCVAPSHCDSIQSWADTNHKALTNSLFENLWIDNRVFYFDSSGNPSKGSGLMIESGSPATNVAHHITLKNSVVLSYRGLNVGDPDDQGVTNNISLVNNTICGVLPNPINHSNHWSYGVFVTKGNSIFADKNIFCDIENWTNGSVSVTNNMVYRSDGKANSPTVSGSNVVANPLLDSNYCPASNSPAISRGWGALPSGCGISVTATPSLVPTITSTKTITNTPTITKTPTVTPTKTVTNTVSPTFTKTITRTPTSSNTPTLVPTETRTPTTTQTLEVTESLTPTPSFTNTITPTRTSTPIVTITPTPVYDRCDYNKNGRIDTWSEFLCVFFRR